MEWSNVISAAMKIHDLTNLNTYILKEEDFLFHHEVISVPSFMPGAKDADIFYLYEQVAFSKGRLYTYTNEWGLHYQGCTFTEDEKYTVIIGPYMEVVPNLYQLTRDYRLANHESNDLRSFCNHIQILSSEKINSFSNVLQLFHQLTTLENNPVRITASSSIKKEVKHSSSSQVSDEEIVRMRYKVEADLVHAVEQGNTPKALQALHAHDGLFSFSERLPNQPLRRIKNLNIILNTLLRSAARRKQVPAVLIHRISEKYAFEIENANQLSQLKELQDLIIKDYSELILSSSLNNYSKVTQTVIEHLMVFYDKKITKEELAELCFTHPSHLSRKFKQETNMTISKFQQQLRLDEAKFLLANKNITVEEVAWLVGYEDSSYFSRVFKKETGYTPSQYMEHSI